MSVKRAICFLFLAAAFSAEPALARQPEGHNENAALRYWSAFSVMRDSAISADQAKKLDAVLAGKARYHDSEFKGLVEKNSLSLRIMARAASLQKCDWGLDYSLGSDEPVEYARDALILGRLNVLYTLHLLNRGDIGAAANAIAAGLHFSQNVANGGTLFATLVADNLISEHLRAASLAAHSGKMSAAQRSVLLKAIDRLGADGVDWRSALHREFQVTRTHVRGDARASEALTRIDSAYIKALADSSAVPALQAGIQSAPSSVAHLIPNLAKTVQEKERLSGQIAQTRSLLQ